MAGHTVELTDAGFRTQVLESKVPVLVDFWATWCGPCKAIAPALEELAADLAGRLVVGKLDIGTQPQTAAAYRITSIPALLLFKEGRVVETIFGAQPKDRLRTKVLAAL
jgi:thioredoxin 1